MNQKISTFLEKVKTPEYQANYLKNIAPKIENRFGTPGRRWNKWHDPKNLNGTICPYCAIGEDCSGELLTSLKNIEKVASTRIGRVVEGVADTLVVGLLGRVDVVKERKMRNEEAFRRSLLK